MIDPTLQTLVAMAKANNALMDGTMEPVRQLIEGHDVVVAVWQDFESQHGVATLIIKGADMLRNSVADQTEVPGRTTAIKCMSYEQAEALREVLGDQGQLH